ncbi:MAG: hypothetical protein A4E67_01530 [Syntrophaceae bacterium PtaB.Bin038]|nr:MAG: hypothetical protein A4E67_01530 [Syntrophaceae bacterium PtaB.Bin038]
MPEPGKLSFPSPCGTPQRTMRKFAFAGTRKVKPSLAYGDARVRCSGSAFQSTQRSRGFSGIGGFSGSPGGQG